MKNPYCWLFYTYLSEFHSRPVDLDDLCEGLAAIRTINEIKGIYTENG